MGPHRVALRRHRGPDDLDHLVGYNAFPQGSFVYKDAWQVLNLREEQLSEDLRRRARTGTPYVRDWRKMHAADVAPVARPATPQWDTSCSDYGPGVTLTPYRRRMDGPAPHITMRRQLTALARPSTAAQECDEEEDEDDTPELTLRLCGLRPKTPFGSLRDLLPAMPSSSRSLLPSGSLLKSTSTSLLSPGKARAGTSARRLFSRQGSRAEAALGSDDGEASPDGSSRPDDSIR
ncbi:hypothetical protein M885DRAFT_508654 [Pelagophyceae sp. CCMP2097]|nr:hypothetical protein M885DRAFT_508654 [Pelagophyceae sp. CCMP2097]